MCSFYWPVCCWFPHNYMCVITTTPMKHNIFTHNVCFFNQHRFHNKQKFVHMLGGTFYCRTFLKYDSCCICEKITVYLRNYPLYTHPQFKDNYVAKLCQCAFLTNTARCDWVATTKQCYWPWGSPQTWFSYYNLYC